MSLDRKRTIAVQGACAGAQRDRGRKRQRSGGFLRFVHEPEMKEWMKRDSRNFGGLGFTIVLAALMLALVVISGLFLVGESDTGLQVLAPFQFAVPAPVPHAEPMLTHTDHLRPKHPRVARIARPHRG